MKTNLTSFIILLTLLVSNFASAAVINHDISKGNLIISGSSTNDYIVTGSTTNHYIVAEFGYKGTITLSNCNFNFTGYGYNSPIRIMGKDNLSNTDPSRTNVNLILEGDNYIYNDGNGLACIQVDQGAQINISAIDPCLNSSGTLIAEQAGTSGGAAIGSLNQSYSYNEATSNEMLNDGTYVTTAGGNVVISSGTITAKGGHGAGIGGGYQTYYDGMIVIYGGVVNASTIRHSAGIGSGCPTGTGVVSEYTPNSAVVVLPPAVVSAYGAIENNTQYPDLGLAGTKVRVYIGDPNRPAINVKTVDNMPNANIYFDLSQDPDINHVVSTTIDPSILNINSVLLGKTNSGGLFSTTGSLINPTTFFTDATSSTGSPYLPTTQTLPNGGNVEFAMLQAKFSIRSTPSSLLEYGMYTSAEAQQSATTLKIVYDDPKPMTNLTFDLASGASTTFAEPIFLASDSATVIPPPTSLKQGDVYYIVVPIKTAQEAKIHTDVLRISGTWDSAPTGYIRQVISQIVASINVVNICEGDSYLFNGEYLTEEGIYTEISADSSACATGDVLNEVIKLIVNSPQYNEIYDTICDGKAYIWAGDSYTTTGVYTKTFTNKVGCDSVVTLNLTISAPYSIEIHDTICSDDVFTWDGVRYDKTGIYTRNYSSIEGCDSIVTLYLTVGEIYDIEVHDTICNGEVYKWNNSQYTTSGSYTQSFISQYGCDSIVTVHLFVAPIPQESYVEAICEGEPYRFGNRTLVRPGVYVDTSLSVYGCDSITTLTLRVHEPYLIDQYVEVCHNDTFIFRGQVIDRPGIYYDSLLTQHGCDSIYRLIFNKTPIYLFQSEDTMCVGSTYNFRGKKLTVPGIYYDSLTTASGCDSIYKLVLHNFSHSDIYSIQVADVCGDDQTLQLIAQYEGDRPEYYNIIYSPEANNQGFKNIKNVPFTSDTIKASMPNASPYIHPDNYSLTLQFGNYKCPQSLSEHTTDFLVRYPSWIIEQNWQDVVAVLNAQHNGGYTFQSYEWYVNNQPASQNRSYMHMPTMKVGDEVMLHVMRAGEDYYVPTCPIIIEQMDAYNQENPIPVNTAKISRNHRQVTIEAQVNTTQYYLYDISGRCLLDGICKQGQIQQFDLPSIIGSYFLTIIDEDNNKQTIHFMLE